jgi:hypothetical protein
VGKDDIVIKKWNWFMAVDLLYRSDTSNHISGNLSNENAMDIAKCSPVGGRRWTISG